MQAYRPWFTVCFFWAPLIVVLLLNPGRNASNIQHFSVPGLLLLALCGICEGFYVFVGCTQLQVFGFAFEDKPQTWWDCSMLCLALLSSGIFVYYAWLGLQLPWRWL